MKESSEHLGASAQVMIARCGLVRPLRKIKACLGFLGKGNMNVRTLIR